MVTKYHCWPLRTSTLHYENCNKIVCCVSYWTRGGKQKKMPGFQKKWFTTYRKSICDWLFLSKKLFEIFPPLYAAFFGIEQWKKILKKQHFKVKKKADTPFTAKWIWDISIFSSIKPKLNMGLFVDFCVFTCFYQFLHDVLIKLFCFDLQNNFMSTSCKNW